MAILTLTYEDLKTQGKLKDSSPVSDDLAETFRATPEKGRWKTNYSMATLYYNIYNDDSSIL